MPIDLDHLIKMENETAVAQAQWETKHQYNKYWVVLKDGISIVDPIKNKREALQCLETESMNHPGSRMSIRPIIYHKTVPCKTMGCQLAGTYMKIVGNYYIYQCNGGHITKVTII